MLTKDRCVMKNIELLSPAGDMNSLIAAVENGTNAVYLGGKNFNARNFAGNFDDMEIRKAIEYCHLRGVKVFVTVNILLRDSELYSMPQYAAYLYNIGADALIIQDIGVGKLIKSILPDFELHASTQMTAHNLQTVNFLYDLGYNRVVLSRELSIGEIQHITSNTKADVEVFAHGALCICYSGQCLMSSMIGGRSGNRGRCAQPCRQSYTLKSSGQYIMEGHVLSPKDLCTIENIDLMVNSGVCSLKIEGRMKKPEYVAAVVSAYRRAIDQYNETGNKEIPEEDKKNLLKVFNRGGFTTAHLFNKGRSEMMSFERPKNWGIYIGKIKRVLKKQNGVEITLEDKLSKGDGIEIWLKDEDNIGYTVESMEIGGKDVKEGLTSDVVQMEYRGGTLGDRVYKTFDAELDKMLKRTYNSADPLRKVPLNCRVIVKRGEPFELCLWDEDGNLVEVKGSMPEEALRVPLSEPKLKEQICKMGGTPFYMDKLDIILEENLSLPVSAVNSIRRDAVEKITHCRIESCRRPEISPQIVEQKANTFLSSRCIKDKKDVKISVLLKDSSLVQSAIDGGADIIIFGGDKLRGYDFNFQKAIKECRDRGVHIYVSSPRIIKNEFSKVAEELSKAVEYGADGIYAENMGVVKYAVHNSIPFSTGFSFNVFNTIAADTLSHIGSNFVSISPELSVSDIKNLAPYVENCEALCYGRVEVMVSEYCPIGAQNPSGCTSTSGRPLCELKDMSITDRIGMEFPIKTDAYCRSHIYNSKILSMLDSMRDLLDSGVNIVRLNIQDEKESDVFGIVRAFKDCVTSIKKGEKIPDSVNDVINQIKDRGYTKGHYYRGVE